MGTSTQQHHPTSTTAVVSAGTTTANPPIRRRDSGGSSASGTNFLTNNNVIVRGRCSPTSSHRKKEGQGTKLADHAVAPMHGAAASMHLTDCRLASSERMDFASEDGHRASSAATCTCTDHADTSLVNIDSMDEDEEGCCDDDISAANTVHEYTSSEDETTLGSKHDEGLSSHAGAFHSRNQSQLMTSFPFQAAFPSSSQQQIMANTSSLHTTASAASAFQHYAASSSFATSAHQHHPPASASPDTKVILHSMHRILNLNQSAINHHSAGGDTSWALDALHKAEWIRCHLVDELTVMQSIHGDINEKPTHDRRMAFCKFKKHHGGLSNSVPSLTTTAASSTSSALTMPQFSSSRQAKYMRRASFSDDRQQQQQQIPTTSAARTSYIYQRMDFDEGMHSFANLEAINPAAFWLPIGGSSSDHANVEGTEVPLMYEMSPVVEATLVFNLGQIHRRTGDLDAASKCYDRALDILQCNAAVLSPTQLMMASLQDMLHYVHPILIPILHNIGQLQYRRGDIHMAMETYTLALRRAQRMYGGQHPHVASALNCLGVLHYHDSNSSEENEMETEVAGGAVAGAGGQQGIEYQGTNSNSSGDNQQQHSSTQKAMDLFQQALSIRIECLGPNHVDVATALNNIGRIHVQLDEFDRALGYYEDALRIRRTVLGVDSLDYAATSFNAGQSFHQKGELTRASELYHEFLRVALINFGHSHRDVAVVLSGIAQIHQEKREYEKALELYEASLCAGRAALGEDHSEIAMLLNRMGNFHFEQERLDDALRCYTRGLRIERKVLPPDHPNIVVTLSNLGEIHRQRSEWDEAAKMYGDCLDTLREKYDNKDHADVASTLSTIGLIHDQRGDTCLSLHYLQDALLMRRRLLGNGHLNVSVTLVYIDTIFYRKSVFSVAIELFSESFQIRKTVLGNYHRDVAFVLYNIALVQQQHGSYDEAIESYGNARYRRTRAG